MSDNKDLKCYTYKVNGMHCAACELLIEEKLSALDGVEKVDAKLGAGVVEVYSSNSTSAKQFAEKFNKTLTKHGYSIGKSPVKNNLFNEWFYALPTALIFILSYSILVRAGLLEAGITGNSSFLQIFMLGFVASLSTCMALVGGIVLSISSALDGQPLRKKYQYQFNFHMGRFIGFFLLGGLLGVLGGVLRPTEGFGIILTLTVSLVLFILALSQMLPETFTRFQFRAPKVIGRYVLSKNIVSPFSSFLVGVLTFFIPCGFTNSVQLVALEAGNFINSAGIMFTFALGTFPALAIVSFATANLSERFNNGIFKKTVGLLILAFAIYYLVLLGNRVGV